MCSQSLDQAAYLLTADIRLLDVFRTDEEKARGLHVRDMVARLPAGKKVNEQTLARSLRLLTTEHWWAEPAPDVFAPLRWALLNTPDTPSYALCDPPSTSGLLGSVTFVEHATDPAQMNLDTVQATPFVRAIHAMGETHIKDFWHWIEQDPARDARFARAMEGLGMSSYPALVGSADTSWFSRVPRPRID